MIPSKNPASFLIFCQGLVNELRKSNQTVDLHRGQILKDIRKICMCLSQGRAGLHGFLKSIRSVLKIQCLGAQAIKSSLLPCSSRVMEWPVARGNAIQIRRPNFVSSLADLSFTHQEILGSLRLSRQKRMRSRRMGAQNRLCARPF